MKRWGIMTAALYGAALVLLTVPVIRAAFPDAYQPERFYTLSGYWVWVGFMTLCALLLILTRVRIARGRDRSRRPLAIAVVVTGALLTLLVLGAVASIGELVAGLHVFDGFASDGWTSLFKFAGITLALWGLWAAVLYWLTRRQAPLSAVRWWARSLLAGSVLELLIAIPSHIVVRQRSECCAGTYTFLGLVTGISVMLLAVGPGVFFLFAERTSRIKQPAPSAGSGL